MHGHVTLISCSPEAAAIIASGGRISTMDGTADEIYAKSLAAGQEKNEKLIGKVLSSGHTSVLEHCYVNLSFENVSVLAEQFLIEFRLASFTVKSRRYVDFSGAGYVAPDFSDPAQAAAFDAAVRALFGIYDELEAAGVPKEDARFVLPYCFCSNFFCSMNARELVHVMNELTYGRGSGIPELRALGESLFAQCEARLPFWALRKPEVYRRTPDWTAARPGRTCHRAFCRAGCRAEDLRRVPARARAGPAAAAGGRADRASEDAPCPTPPPGAGTGELYAALRRPLARRAHAPDATPDAVALPAAAAAEYPV